MNLKNNFFFQKFDSLLLFLGLFSTFFLWDIKNIYFDLRFLIIICSLIFLIINFRSLDLMNYYIIGAILFILIHYFINFIKRDLSFNYNVFIFTFYLLISFYFINFKKQKFTNIPPRHLLPGELAVYNNFLLKEKADGILINNNLKT